MEEWSNELPLCRHQRGWIGTGERKFPSWSPQGRSVCHSHLHRHGPRHRRPRLGPQGSGSWQGAWRPRRSPRRRRRGRRGWGGPPGRSPAGRGRGAPPPRSSPACRRGTSPPTLRPRPGCSTPPPPSTTQSPSRERGRIGDRKAEAFRITSSEPKDTNLPRSPKAVHRRDGTNRICARHSLLARIAAASLRIWLTPSRFGKNPPICTALQDKNRAIVANKPPIRLVCTWAGLYQPEPNPKCSKYPAALPSIRAKNWKIYWKRTRMLQKSTANRSTIFCCNGTGTPWEVTRRFFGGPLKGDWVLSPDPSLSPPSPCLLLV